MEKHNIYAVEKAWNKKTGVIEDKKTLLGAVLMGGDKMDIDLWDAVAREKEMLGLTGHIELDDGRKPVPMMVCELYHTDKVTFA